MSFGDVAVIFGVVGFGLGIAISNIIDHYRRK